MDLGLKGRKAIVCASSRGLGKGCAAALAAEGCDLVINGRNGDITNATADELRAMGVEVTVVLGDVSDPQVQEQNSSPPALNRTSWSTTMAARRCAISAISTATRSLRA